ncbi:MAG: hypothetical protein MJ102_05585 [Clostridia bacterium]|nr:hypothetical protein [Clostridia bacterium]
MRLISLVNVPDDLCIQFSRSTEAVLLAGRSAPSLYLDKGVPKCGVFSEKSLKNFLSIKKGCCVLFIRATKMNKSQLIHEEINWLYGMIFSVFSAKNGLPLYTIQNRLYATAGAALVANWLHKNGNFILIFVHWLIAQPQICQKPLFYGVFRRFLKLFKIILCNRFATLYKWTLFPLDSGGGFRT